MKAPAYLFSLILLLICSCQGIEEPFGDVETFWVYSYPVSCDPKDPTKTTCLGISKAKEFDYEWLVQDKIPLEIEGFTFKPKYLQKIQVQKFKNLNTKKITTKLIRILEEERDYYDLLEGNWKIRRYLGKDLPNPSFPGGQSVLISPGIRVAASYDGCNSISLQIKKVGPDRIISFGNARSTLVACNPLNMILPFPGLNKKFKREGNILTFYSEEEGEVAVWEKMK